MNKSLREIEAKDKDLEEINKSLKESKEKTVKGNE